MVRSSHLLLLVIICHQKFSLLPYLIRKNVVLFLTKICRWPNNTSGSASRKALLEEKHGEFVREALPELLSLLAGVSHHWPSSYGTTALGQLHCCFPCYLLLQILCQLLIWTCFCMFLPILLPSWACLFTLAHPSTVHLLLQNLLVMVDSTAQSKFFQRSIKHLY